LKLSSRRKNTVNELPSIRGSDSARSNFTKTETIFSLPAADTSVDTPLSSWATLTFWSDEKKIRWPCWSSTLPGPEMSTVRFGTGACGETTALARTPTNPRSAARS
jgi:hypothetical protein